MSRNAASGRIAAAKQCWRPVCVAANHGRTPHQNGENPGRRTFWRAAHGHRQGPTRVQRYVFEAAGLLGVKKLNFDSAQTTLPRDSTSPSYGYRFGVGVNLAVFENSSLKFAAYYVDNRATKLADQANYNLSSLTFSLGLNF